MRGKTANISKSPVAEDDVAEKGLGLEIGISFGVKVRVRVGFISKYLLLLLQAHPSWLVAHISSPPS